MVVTTRSPQGHYDKPFDFDELLTRVSNAQKNFKNDRRTDHSEEWSVFLRTSGKILESTGEVARTLKSISTKLSQPENKPCRFVQASGKLGETVVSVLSSSKLESACRILSFAPYAGMAFSALVPLLEAIHTSGEVDIALTVLFQRIQRLTGYLEEVLKYVATRGSDAKNDKTFCILSSVLQRCVTRIEQIKVERGGWWGRTTRSGDQCGEIEALKDEIDTTLLERGTIDTIKALGSLVSIEKILDEDAQKIDLLFKDNADFKDDLKQLTKDMKKEAEMIVHDIDAKLELYSKQASIKIEAARASIVMAVSKGNDEVSNRLEDYFQASTDLMNQHYHGFMMAAAEDNETARAHFEDYFRASSTLMNQQYHGLELVLLSNFEMLMQQQAESTRERKEEHAKQTWMIKKGFQDVQEKTEGLAELVNDCMLDVSPTGAIPLLFMAVLLTAVILYGGSNFSGWHRNVAIAVPMTLYLPIIRCVILISFKMPQIKSSVLQSIEGKWWQCPDSPKFKGISLVEIKLSQIPGWHTIKGTLYSPTGAKLARWESEAVALTGPTRAVLYYVWSGSYEASPNDRSGVGKLSFGGGGGTGWFSAGDLDAEDKFKYSHTVTLKRADDDVWTHILKQGRQKVVTEVYKDMHQDK